MSDILIIKNSYAPIIFNPVRVIAFRNTLIIKDSFDPVVFNPGPYYTTLSGTVSDALGNPLQRTIKIYKGENMATLIAIIESLSDGTWSFETIGCEHDKFTVVAQGEDGENFPIHSDILGAPVT